MSIIDIQNLTFSHDGGVDNIFENASFRLDTDWKLGLVGRNGRGKTTLLHILEGKLEYSGKISADVKFTYFPFAVARPERTAYEVATEVAPLAEDWEIVKGLNQMQMDAECLYRPFSLLSSGEQTKILLVALFLGGNNFLLIDEPTNHLDYAARRTVSQFLRRQKGFILVSHDRAFVDGCIDHVMAINKTSVEVQSGNFSSYLKNFDERQAAEKEHNARLEKEIIKLKASAAATSVWAQKTEKEKRGKTSAGLSPDRGFIGHKAEKLMKRAKVIEARVERAIEQKSALLKDSEYDEQLALSPLVCRTERLVALSDVSIFYGDKQIFSPTSLQIKRGRRIAVDGINGCGKSSLLKLIAGENLSHSGSIERAASLVVSYLPQTPQNIFGTVSDYARNNELNEPRFRAILSKLGFARSELNGDISAFSDGQKKKIAIAKSLCENAHLYVWDEPLNYLDIYARLQIERLILDVCPTMIFVEHDAAFRSAVATDTLSLS